MNTNSLDQTFVECHSRNKSGHISEFCKSKVGNKLNPEQKNGLNLEKVRKEMVEIWRKKEKLENKEKSDNYVYAFGANTSSMN